MAVHRFGRFGDGFAVRDLRSKVFDGDLFKVLDMPFGEVQVKFALSLEDDLFQFLREFIDKRRVHLGQFVQDAAHLFIIGGIFGLHGNPEFRVGIGGRFDDIVGILKRVKGIVGIRRFSF